MKIHGLQKLTLLDFPEHVACTVFLAGCNLRCPYCHNSGLLTKDAEPLMDSDAFFDFLETRVGILDGVCITGGEPFLTPELPDFLAEIKRRGFQVKLDTNGTFPEKLAAVIKEGLADAVAMDIKNAPDRYAETTGLPLVDISAVKESAALLMNSGIDYEFRTTVTAEHHNEESFKRIAAWLAGARKYYLQPFADRESVLVSGLHTPSEEDLKTYRNILLSTISVVGIRG